MSLRTAEKVAGACLAALFSAFAAASACDCEYHREGEDAGGSRTGEFGPDAAPPHIWTDAGLKLGRRARSILPYGNHWHSAFISFIDSLFRGGDGKGAGVRRRGF
jgi:hypothetical protein